MTRSEAIKQLNSVGRDVAITISFSIDTTRPKCNYPHFDAIFSDIDNRVMSFMISAIREKIESIYDRKEILFRKF
jgi:hypothetical protein